MSYIQFDGKIEVLASINGVLGALVAVTGRYLHLTDNSTCQRLCLLCNSRMRRGDNLGGDCNRDGGFIFS